MNTANRYDVTSFPVLSVSFSLSKRGSCERGGGGRARLGTVHEHAGGNVRINIAYRCVISDVFCLNKIMKLTGGKCRAGRREREVGRWGGGAPANCAAIRYRFRIN